MTLSLYEYQKREEEKNQAASLYKQGFSLRRVAKMMDKSHEWVRKACQNRHVDKSSEYTVDTELPVE